MESGKADRKHSLMIVESKQQMGKNNIILRRIRNQSSDNIGEKLKVREISDRNGKTKTQTQRAQRWKNGTLRNRGSNSNGKTETQRKAMRITKNQRNQLRTGWRKQKPFLKGQG